jgi:DinB superfamily
MRAGEPASSLRVLLFLLDQAFDHTAWHGPNLKASIRGVSARLATWRPVRGRHCIAEIVQHAAYWKYVARRRLRGDPRGSFSLPGTNWFPLPAPFSEPRWRDYVALLEAEHHLLRQTVAELPPERIDARPAGSKVSSMALIVGAASHDLYHAGQIRLLRGLQKGKA